MELTTVPVVSNERQCLYCGRFLPAQTGKGRPRLYCSPAHRKRYEREQANPKYRRWCPICGTELDPSKRAGAIYDKTSCRLEAHQRRIRAEGQ